MCNGGIYAAVYDFIFIHSFKPCLIIYLYIKKKKSVAYKLQESCKRNVYKNLKTLLPCFLFCSQISDYICSPPYS